MKMSMKTLLVIFIGALLPLSTAAWAASVNGTATNTTVVDNQTIPASNATPVDVTNITNETNISAIQAYNLLVIVDKVANYTACLIAELNESNVTISNYTLDLYSRAEEMRARAWELYNAGNYSDSINASMEALCLYREVIEDIIDHYGEHEEKKMEEEHEYYETIMEAREELHRAEEYFPYVEKVIAEAKAEGLNVTSVMELYNETKAAYMVVAQDLDSGNVTSLRSDLEYAEELMDKLEDAVEELSERIVFARAEEISRTFMEKLQRQMELMEKLITPFENMTMNATGIEEEFLEFQTMYEQFNLLVESAQYDEALEMIQVLNEELFEMMEITMELEDPWMGSMDDDMNWDAWEENFPDEEDWMNETECWDPWDSD
ncbi:hypothetical protein [Thermococcus sp. 5-4]|uniref:hypothetical protein n=1 Tax=Thermococcus sp. 5-4 TaxID=2008440 RepID=UPI0018752D85|nr:hypothetical protein [Thermococcus sp. 5-4]